MEHVRRLAQVAGFAPNTEWSFSKLDFDGFRASLCQLEEATANYDQFWRRVSRNSFSESPRSEK
ncbi:Tox-REase-5 domain-containing protein [Paraburkholderia caledonica]|uniref:Tox-REase-5 domain-containing protein n=1 Tax=Paraburkholderia caledonica TaxID=134536 RepID=UPI0037093C4D